MSAPQSNGQQIPASALFLGFAGVLPFLWGLLTMVSPTVFNWGQEALGPRFVGQYVQVFYGTIILSFMSGVLWGFATRAEGALAVRCYAMSVVPALWAFFFVGGGAGRAAVVLIAGFLGLLALDYAFWRQGLAPVWWMQLRGMLTGLVVASLVVGLVV